MSQKEYFDQDYEEANVYYYHSDHLGSTSYVTNLAGEEFEHMVYTPYGESWIDEGSNKHLIGYRFTSKELDAETGLYYFGARYLDPKTSQWMSVDPAGPKLINPNREGFNHIESLNWYGYVANNPVKYNDPTGMAIPAAVYAVSAYLSAVATAPDTQMDIMSMSENVAMGDWVSAGFDLVGMLVPGLTNTDEVYRGAKKLIAEYGDDIVIHARKYLDEAGAKIHHLASDKAKVSGFTAQFKDIFSKAGKSLQDAWNKIPLIGHKGPHGPQYNQDVLDRLKGAVEGLTPHTDEYEKAVNAVLESVAKDVLPGGDLAEFIY